MKKFILVFLFLFISLALFGQYVVGDVITQDYDWTDNNGDNHSIYELTAQGKAIVMFWGGYG